jgi:asparagine synthase (glutamine-hydrolysing)
MCGFLGSSFKENKSDFIELLKLGGFRGPDSVGLWKNENIQLGFNRLAIQDLSENGNQPMHSNLNSWVIVFNGEIYNHNDIRRGLADYQFKSNSDTETILASLEKNGFENTVCELNGMFAFAAYNLDEQKVYLARDFAGIKPLYFGLLNQNIVFASQFNQIFKHIAFSDNLVLRSDIMKEYFALGYMHAPNTIYEGIFQLEPGQFLVWDVLNSKISQKEYFYQWKVNPTIPEDKDNMDSKFNDLFSKVVRNQLISDVPIASFLSGGIDSPLVAAHARNSLNSIKAFTIGVDDENLDETKYATEYAKQLNIEHKVEDISELELLDIINEHFDYMPEPHGDKSSIPTFLICKKAKEYATVMLSGDGGDELFWGYPRFIRTISHLKYFRIPGILRKVLFFILRKCGIEISYGICRNTTLGDWILKKQIHFKKIDSLIPNEQFSKELQELYSFDVQSKHLTLLALKKNEFYGHLQRVLRKVDMMSMANSLEVRVPFLDKRIIEFSQQIKPLLGINHSTNKLVLKKALLKFIPMELILKEKRGFEVPLEKWLKGPLRRDLEHCLLEMEIYGSNYLKVEVIKCELDNFLNGKSVSEWGIWHIYSWQKWALSNGLIKK